MLVIYRDYRYRYGFGSIFQRQLEYPVPHIEMRLNSLFRLRRTMPKKNLYLIEFSNNPNDFYKFRTMMAKMP